MAKKGLDYFPVLCHFDPDTELLEAEFGIKGIAVLLKLYQRIYGGHGYYCEWNDEVALLFARRECGIPAGAEGCGVVSEVVNAALKRGIFDRKTHERHGVLTSAVIQETYLEAVKRRTDVEVQKEYLLLSAPAIPKNVNIVSGNAYINAENAYRNGQSKVNKNKKSVRSAPPSVKEVAAYCAERKNGVDAEAFVAFYESKGWMVGKNEMRDWKAAVRTWEKRENIRPQGGSRNSCSGNSFNAYPQRDYDYGDLERKLLAR